MKTQEWGDINLVRKNEKVEVEFWRTDGDLKEDQGYEKTNTGLHPSVVRTQ